MTQEEKIIHKVRLLEELVESQTRTLDTANTIIDMKNRMIELYQKELDLYRRENNRLTTSLIISGVLFAILGVLNLTRLFI